MHSDSKARKPVSQWGGTADLCQKPAAAQSRLPLPGPRAPCSWLCQQRRHVAVSSAPVLQLGTHPPNCPHSLQVLTNHPNNEQRLTFFLCCR